MLVTDDTVKRTKRCFFCAITDTVASAANTVSNVVFESGKTIDDQIGLRTVSVATDLASGTINFSADALRYAGRVADFVTSPLQG